MSPSLYASVLSVFEWVIQASFMASILVVFVLILQFLLNNKLEARWHYLLWMPVVIRLLLPWAPESSLSLYNMFPLDSIAPGIHERVQDSAAWHKWRTEAADMNEASVLNGSFAAEKMNVSNQPHLSGSEQRDHSWWSVFKQMGFTNMLMLVWLVGVLFLTVKTVVDQLRLKRALRAGRAIDTPYLSSVFQETKQLLGIKRNVCFVATEQISGPAVVGLRNPAIVISPSLLVTLQKDQLRYILVHEFAHIKRWDVAVNWIMHILLILHWFNPLLWLAVHKARQHQEIACDACALDRLSPKQNYAYGQTILHVLEHFSGYHQQPGLAALSATHKQMKRRLIMIKHFHKKSYKLSILGLSMLLALGSVSLVNAKESNTGSASQLEMVYPEGVDSAEEQVSYKKGVEEAHRKYAEAAKSIPAEDLKFIENEENRVKQLHKETGGMFILYHKYKGMNSGLDLSYWGGIEHFTSYEDYLKKASTLEGAILQQPSNLPKGFTFSKARIEGPTEGKFVEEVRAEGKKSGKPIYVKKIDWKEAAAIRLEYTNGKETIALSKYTFGPDDVKKKGFFEDDLPAHIYPKYMFLHDDKHEYSVSATFDMSKKDKIEILKEAVKK
ncbi:M56 family metallopeptidase [Paenibacillus sp. SC116]|uniref:M56 family metallopeptidase n=1 Tax=Paenibacillus sp. SC116 TaxID=2968986 RepID=UPI00215B23E5|nr:M56 family metallopeptidase [Paenibacillus sp. SC116]MCR8842447.1 M56 family metallopeptidase [Paenibacillus sp. SC116]